MTYNWQIINPTLKKSLLAFKDELVQTIQSIDTKMFEFYTKIKTLENTAQTYEANTIKFESSIENRLTSLTGRIDSTDHQISTITNASPDNLTDSVNKLENT